MLLPADFLEELDAESRDAFLDSLVIAHCGADAYDGDLVLDRKSLAGHIREGLVRVEFSEESETFRLLDPRQAEATTF